MDMVFKYGCITPSNNNPYGKRCAGTYIGLFLLRSKNTFKLCNFTTYAHLSLNGIASFNANWTKIIGFINFIYHLINI